MPLLPSFLRRRVVPEAVKAVRLPDGQRRLAWAVTTAGEPVVAGERTLVLPGGRLLPWWQVERAAWRPPTLSVLEVAEVEGSGARHELTLEEPGDLAEVVRTRVTASVAWTAHEKLARGGVRVVGRRVPGQELLSWQLVYDEGTDPSDPLVRAQAEQLVDQARRALG